MIRQQAARLCAWAPLFVALTANSSLGALTHQYTFNDGTANDSVGGAHGTLVNGATVAAGQLQLANPNFSGPSTAGRYLSLPPTILPASGSVTIEQWFTFTGSGFFTEAWTFSDNSDDTNPPGADIGQYLMHTISNPQPANPPGGPNTGGSRIVQTLAGFGGGAESSAYSSTPGIGAGGGGYLDDGGTYMAATVIDGTAGTLSYYVFRQSDGVGGLQQTIPAIPLESYSFTNAYLGRSAFPNDNSTSGVVDEFRVYDEARTAEQILADFLAGPVGGGPKLTIDRSTGAITLSTSSTPLQIFQYTVNSPSGALDIDNIQPISQRLDAVTNGGNGSFDDNDAWEVLSFTANSVMEQDIINEGAEDGGTLGTVVLSAGGGWIKSFRQDITASIQIMDGVDFTTFNLPVEYTGNNNQAFQRSDLNFDGIINGVDWNVFRANHLVPIDPTLTLAESAGLGDLDGDLDVDVADFRLFKTDFIAANGAAAWAALSVPEPGSLALAAVACALAVAARRRAGLAALLLAAMGPAMTAQADLTHKYTFNDGTANDSVGTAHGALINGATVSVGGQAALDGLDDYVDLPGPTIAINTYTDTTFEAWFTINAQPNWIRLFDFGDTNADGLGRQYFFYTPSSGPGDNRAALSSTDPGFNLEDQALATGRLPAGVPHHVAVVVDKSVTNTMSVYVDGVLAPGTQNPVTPTNSLDSVSNVFAYLGRSLYNPDAYMPGFIDEFRIYDNALSAAQIAANFAAGPELVDLLALNVNIQTGNISLQNTSSAPQSFDYYQISSAGGKLQPADGNWNSLDDQNIDAVGGNPGESWDESGGATANQLAELFLQGASTLAPGASYNLGNAYNTALGAGDLKFQFSLPSGEFIAGKVNYISGSGDFNGDGQVNGNDFLIWQRNLGITSGATLTQGDADGNGAVNAADLAIWKSTFGSSVAAAGAIPEPASGFLAAVAAFAISVRARRRPT